MFKALTGATALAFMLAFPGGAAAAPPPNDGVAGATAVGSLPFTDTLDTSQATQAADDPDCVGRGPTVWYVFTAASDMAVEAHTSGSDYDTTLSVYTGSPGSLLQLACNDDAAGLGLRSRVAFHASAGVTYRLMVGAYASGPGGLLRLRLTPAGQPQANVTLDATGVVYARSGLAIISGTYTCSNGWYLAGFSTMLAQTRVGLTTYGGFGFMPADTCDGQPRPWSIAHDASNGRFVGGPVDVRVSLGACATPTSCAFDEVRSFVTLRSRR